MLNVVPVIEYVIRVFVLQVSDQLVEINGDSTAGMTHSQAVEQIRRGGHRIHLVLKRGNGYVPDYGEDEGLFGVSPPCVCRINYRLNENFMPQLSFFLLFWCFPRSTVSTSVVRLAFILLTFPHFLGFPCFQTLSPSLSVSQWSSPACLSV